MAPSASTSPCAIVCTGKHCRGDARDQLCVALRAMGMGIQGSGCLGVCRGPVVMLPIRGRWTVLERVRGQEARKNLRRMVARQRRRPLRDRLVAGAKKRRAIARGAARS